MSRKLCCQTQTSGKTWVPKRYPQLSMKLSSLTLVPRQPNISLKHPKLYLQLFHQQRFLREQDAHCCLTAMKAPTTSLTSLKSISCRVYRQRGFTERRPNPHLKVTKQVLEGGGVGNDGGLMSAVNCSHQREGEMEDVAVEQRALLLQQHSQQLHRRKE